MTNGTDKHFALRELDFEDGILVWGGRKVTEIANELGSSPFYAYDSGRMTRRVSELRRTLPAEIEFHYAMKANPLPSVVAHMANLVDGLDVASAGELEVALATATPPQDISFAGPGKRDVELARAINAGITINMESEGEMQRVARLGAELGIRPSVAIRVNPQFALKSAGMKMGGRPSQFGIDAEKVPATLAQMRHMDLDFRGFHVFSGSQNLRADAIEQSMAHAVDLVIELAGSTGSAVSFVNLGGGFGIPYFPKEQPLELAALTTPAERAVRKLRSAFGETCQVIFELGRYLVGESGIYVCRVIDIKESRGTRFAITDGGLHHHLAASGNFGQVIRKNYPVTAVESTEREEEVTIVGPLCTPLDLLADRMVMSRINVGSLIAVLQSGAYGRTASPAEFLSHPACGEILI
jgi:diaminopimelate decarboxylase